MSSRESGNVRDCIVIGTGAMGSAACWFAARRGWSVLGLDRFPPGHDRGSSHGQSRIMRTAYFEHPDYVPLLREAQNLWREIEDATGRNLFLSTGLLQVGRPDGPVIQGIIRSAEAHGLDVERLEGESLRSRFPMFRFPPDSVGLLESGAGILRVEKCVRAMAELARRCGATIRSGVTVSGWQSDTGVFQIETDQGEFRAKRLIVTAGAWTADLLPEFRGRLRVIAKHQHWFVLPSPLFRADRGCPTYFFETADGYFYGFPDFDGQGIKVAEHSGGTVATDPSIVNRLRDDLDFRRVKSFIRDFVGYDELEAIAHNVCLYTLTEDEHFVVDRTESESPPLAFACGFSGHGFKFSPVIGKALVELLDDKVNVNMRFLRSKRLMK